MGLGGGGVHRVAPALQHMDRWTGSKSALGPNSWAGAVQSINSLKHLLTWLSQQTSPSASFHPFIPGDPVGTKERQLLQIGGGFLCS